VDSAGFEPTTSGDITRLLPLFFKSSEPSISGIQHIGKDEAIEIARNRFARGEISPEEYEHISTGASVERGYMRAFAEVLFLVVTFVHDSFSMFFWTM
jgi:hypothetical protein